MRRSFVKDLPLSEIRIDRAFVSGILQNKSDRMLIKSIIGLGASNSIPLVAECVETAEQVNLLAEYGCDMLQGYYFAEPMPFAFFVDQAA